MAFVDNLNNRLADIDDELSFVGYSCAYPAGYVSKLLVERYKLTEYLNEYWGAYAKKTDS